MQAIRHGDTSLPASLNATDDEVPCDGSTEAKRERVRRNRWHPRARASDQTRLEDESDGTKGTRGTPILHVSDRVKRRSKGNPPTPIGRHPSKGNVRTKPTWKALARRMGQDDDDEEMEKRENERRTGTRNVLEQGPADRERSSRVNAVGRTANQGHVIFLKLFSSDLVIPVFVGRNAAAREASKEHVLPIPRFQSDLGLAVNRGL